MDDKTAKEAIQRGLPIPMVWRRSGGTGVLYIGQVEDSNIIDEGSCDGLMEILLFTQYDHVVKCGRCESSKFAWKMGALTSINAIPREEHNLQRCFVPLI